MKQASNYLIVYHPRCPWNSRFSVWEKWNKDIWQKRLNENLLVLNVNYRAMERLRAKTKLLLQWAHLVLGCDFESSFPLKGTRALQRNGWSQVWVRKTTRLSWKCQITKTLSKAALCQNHWKSNLQRQLTYDTLSFTSNNGN